ncbi:MAG: hypothetical protein V3W52_17245 [Syntrophobacteria bacterium]
MGLDMYLTKRVYVGANHEHMKVTGTLEVQQDGKEICSGIENLSEVVYHVGYWRKANHIHKWFVEKIQDGVDECQESYVPKDRLKDLDQLCEQVLGDHSLAGQLLPCQSGFFFGGEDYDEWYFSDLEDTRKVIKGVLEDDKTGEIYYRSSW